ncbi:MAG: glycosyltransferase family 4 protein [Rubellimicrobium sp.]|nr:glycosyltransferase family 4 protein [Rubellimicrobium sp.]
MTPHILFAAYQTDRGSNGGMESATRIFEALAGDFCWTLMTNRETPRTERWRAGGARVVWFGFDEYQPSALRAVRLAMASSKVVVAGWEADVLHGNDIRGVQILAPLARFSRKPLAFTLRDTKPVGERYGPHWHRVARRLDALVTLSDDMMTRVGDRLPVPAARRHTISSIVDLQSFRPARDRSILRSRLGIGAGELALGIVAGVFDKKCQLEVIRDVMPTLVDLPARLHLIGDFTPDTEPYARACLEAAAGSGDRVVFHGFRRDVADWLAALDVVLVASVREGLARCMIEAMSCGTPVVSVDVSSAREVLEPTGAGLVVPAGDWAAMAGAIRRLAGDPAMRREMGLVGRKAAEERFSVLQVKEDWRSLYMRLSTLRLKGNRA